MREQFDTIMCFSLCVFQFDHLDRKIQALDASHYHTMDIDDQSFSEQHR
jgi:hypothetical protein